MVCWSLGWPLSADSSPVTQYSFQKCLLCCQASCGDPSEELSSFGSSRERRSLPPPSLVPPINPGPSLPPVGSH